MTGNKFNGITYFLKGKRSFYTLLLAMIFVLTTSIAAYAEQVQVPNAYPIEGTYGGTQNIQLYTSTTGATIYYTTDNSEPNIGSNQYKTPIVVTSNTIIKAIAVKEGMENSAVRTSEYVIFASGDGTETNPYQVATAEQLDNVRKYLTKHFIQTKDINLGVAPYNTGEGWGPIGDQFQGTFDGNKKIISNLTIKRDTGPIGLFSATWDNAKIQNVKLDNAKVNGMNATGALVGQNHGRITNSYATGTVDGGNHVGGLVGDNMGSITNSYASVHVTGKEVPNVASAQTIGGLVGYNWNGSITNSYATGTVNGKYGIGGLAGDSIGSITNSYAAGNVNGYYGTGGLVGGNLSGGTITNSYATGNVDGTGNVGGLAGNNHGEITKAYAIGLVTGTSDVGGLVGKHYEGNIYYSYWDKYTSGRNSSAGGEGAAGKTTAEMKLQETYEGWDFNDTWSIDGSKNDGYPFLIKDRYVITANVAGGTATVTTNPATEAAANATVTVSIANIEAGKQFKSITVTDADSGAVATTEATAGESYTFTMPAKAVTVAVEVEAIPVTVTGISVKTPPTKVTYTADETLDLTGLVVTLTKSDSSSEDVALANFTAKGISASPADGTVLATTVTKVTLTHTASSKSVEQAIIVSDTTPSNPTIASITAVTNVQVAYGTTEPAALTALATTTTITDSNNGSHTVNLSWSIASYDGNTAGNYTATGTFTLPTGVDQSDPQTELKVTATVTVNAAVPAQTYTLTITAATGGSITIGSSGNYAAGTIITITATPVSGYSFNKWTSTGGGTFANANNASTTYTMPANPATITATFTYNSSSGGSSGGGGGSTTPSGTQVTPSGRTTSQNGVTLIFPAGAVESDIRVQVQTAGLTTGMTLPDNSQLLSRIMNIVKDKSGNFLKPVTITLSFNNYGLDPDKYDIAIYYYDEDTGKWIALNNISLNFNTGTISGDTAHFTKFAVIATPKTVKEEKPAQPITPPPAVNIPTDISGHWAKDSIMKMINAGVISGYPDGNFKPDKAVTRAEFTVMVVKALNLETRTGKTFTDTASHWGKESIATAAAHSIISGYDENTFGPDDLITREQAAVIVSLAAKLEAATGELNFTDGKAISPWAKPGVAAAFKGGFISGYPDSSFKPQGNTTRAEAVSLILKVI